MGIEETVSDNKTEDMVLTLSTRVCAGVPVCASPPHLVRDIVRCHRIGKQIMGRPRLVIVKVRSERR